MPFDARRAADRRRAARRSSRSPSWPGVFRALDRVLHATNAGPSRALRRARCAQAERWIVERQEADGSWGGIQPPWVYSLMALHLLGYPVEHPVIQKGLEGLDTLHDRGGRDAPARGLPVAGLGHRARADRARRRRVAGRPRGGRARRRAGCCSEEIAQRGDWAVRRPDARAGRLGRSSSQNDNYPDIDDTAEVDPRAAPRARLPGWRRPSGAASPGRSGCESKSGGWGAFDADNDQELIRKLPFCDFGEVIDPPSADVTAHVVEMLARRGARATMRRPGAGSSGCCASRRRTARGSGAGAATTSTAPARPCPRWSRPGSLAEHDVDPPRRPLARAACRTPTAAGARTCARTDDPAGWSGARRVDRVADGVGAARAARGGRARRARSSAGSAGSARRSARTGAGTSRSSPAPASRATSTSTTTCTGSCSR